MKKYKIDWDDKKLVRGSDVYRIVALKSFGKVCAGDLGGYIHAERNLSQYGECWVFEDGVVKDNARILDDACVLGGVISDNTLVNGSSCIDWGAKIEGTSKICNSSIKGDVFICGESNLYEVDICSPYDGEAYEITIIDSMIKDAKIEGHNILLEASNIITNGTILSNVTIINSRYEFKAHKYNDRLENVIISDSVCSTRLPEGSFVKNSDWIIIGPFIETIYNTELDDTETRENYIIAAKDEKSDIKILYWSKEDEITLSVPEFIEFCERCCSDEIKDAAMRAVKAVKVYLG